MVSRSSSKNREGATGDFTHSLTHSLLASLLLMSGATAQRRTEFVFHVYVDPIYGDNGSAWEMNPGNPDIPSLATFCRFGGMARPKPLATRDEINANNTPHNATNDNYSLTGHLQHASYPFRTLTGNNGALAYIDAVFDNVAIAGAGDPVLPWENPDNHAQVTHVVVHCLPGLYGPRRDDLASDELDIDPLSGLAWNGEVFPVELGEGPVTPAAMRLWNRVSIQGTSALDTVFDGRSTDGDVSVNRRSSDIFRVWCGAGANDNQNQAFLDGLTIRNAGSIEGATNGMHGIGVHIVGNSQSIRLRVSNCFFVDNVAGIVLDAFPNGEVVGIHRPVIANNTFVGNLVGIWQGKLTQQAPSLYTQAHNPLVINNILQAPQPSPQSSCFEGIAGPVLLIDVVNGASIVPRDFNAWRPANTNFGFIPPVPNWGLADLGWVSLPVLPSPRVDLTPLANLFVRDLLAGAGIFNARHDFRLSPFVSNNPAVSPGAMTPLAPNPLIGAGVDRAVPNLPLHGIQNVAGNFLDFHPGLPDGVEECAVHGWDWDCEGFGNQRLLPRNGIMPNPMPQFGTVDIGADQCGGLIMAGYIPSTRMFACQSPQVGVTGHDRIFYVDQPNVVGLPRPHAVWRPGLLDWFANVQLPPEMEPVPCAGSAPTFFSEGFWSGSGFSPRAFVYFVTQGFGPTPRNLGCDFGPSLLPDGHGFWDHWMTKYAAAPIPQPWVLPDPFATNPIYHSWWQEWTGSPASLSGPTVAGFFPDNGNLFHNRHEPDPHGSMATWDFLKNQRTWVLDAHINPPASLLDLGADTQFLASPSIFGPFGPCTPSFFDTGTWGLNDACPDTLPSVGLSLGLRINCEIPLSSSLSAANTNLQTLLVLANCGDGNAQQGMAGLLMAAATSSAPSPVRVDLGSFLNLPSEFGEMANAETYLREIARTLGGGQ